MVSLGMDPETAGPLAYSRVSSAKHPRDGEPIALSTSAAYCRVLCVRPTFTHHWPSYLITVTSLAYRVPVSSSFTIPSTALTE